MNWLPIGGSGIIGVEGFISLIALSTSIFIYSASALKFFDFSFITLASARVAAALIVAFSAAILASIANLTDASPLDLALASAIALFAFIWIFSAANFISSEFVFNISNLVFAAFKALLTLYTNLLALVNPVSTI